MSIAPIPTFLAGRAFRCIGMPFSKREACFAKPPRHPPFGKGRAKRGGIALLMTHAVVNSSASTRFGAVMAAFVSILLRTDAKVGQAFLHMPCTK